MNTSAIDKACEIAGGPSALAQKLGVAASTVSQWRLPESDKRHRPIPLEYCVRIEKETEGQVKCEALRPQWAAHFRYLRQHQCCEAAARV